MKREFRFTNKRGQDQVQETRRYISNISLHIECAPFQLRMSYFVNKGSDVQVDSESCMLQLIHPLTA